MAAENGIGRLLTGPERAVWPDGDVLRTGFVIDPGLVLTAWHCVRDAGGTRAELWLRLQPLDGASEPFVEVPVRYVAHDAELDVALLAVDGRYGVLAGVVFPLGSEVEPGDEVRIGGYPERNTDLHATLFVGTVQSADTRIGRHAAIRVHVPPFGDRYPESPGGMSGGPLTRKDADGRERVVGVVISYPRSGDDQGATGATVIGRRIAEVSRRFPQVAALMEGTAPAAAPEELVELRQAVRKDVADEIEVRRLRHQQPISIDWVVDLDAMSEPAAERARAGLTADLYRNDVDQVARLQLAAPNGQLVILGPPGSGKSTALLLLMEELLRRSARLPVLLSLAGWDPTAETLDDWIVRRVREQYRSARPGPDRLRTLLDEGRILPLLDGLDEMAAVHWPHALESVDGTAGARRPYVLTCRSEQFIGPVLSGALVVRLEPATVEAAISYLKWVGPPGRWEGVRTAMLARPDGALRRTLTNPLMTWLTRIVYALPDKPLDKLLRAESERDIADDLRLRLLPELFGRPVKRGSTEPTYTVATAGRTLRLVAACLGTDADHVDFGWWDLYRIIPFGQRLAVAVAAFYAAAVPYLSLAWLVPRLNAVAPLVTLAAGVFGPFVGLCLALGGPPRYPTRLGGGLGSEGPAGLSRAGIQTHRFRLVLGVMLGLASAVIGGALTRNALFAGCLLVVGTGLGAFFTMFRSPDVVQAATPEGVFRDDLTALLAFVIASPVAVGVAGGVVGYLAGGFTAPVCGAWAGGVFGALGGVTLRRRYNPLAGMLFAVGTGIVLGAVVGWLAGGAVDGLLVTTATGTGLGFCFGVATALANTSSGWYLTTLLLLGAGGRSPFRLLRFLRVTHRKGLLRRQGSVYQFRHVVLQEWALGFSDEH